MTAEREQTVNYKAAAWTVAVHVLLFLLFFFLKYASPAPEPPLPEMGMEVNLGTAADGFGVDQPMNTNAPAAQEAASASGSIAVSGSLGDLLTGSEPDAPVVSTNTTEGNEASNQTSAKANTENTSGSNNTPQQSPKYVYAGGTGTGGNNAAENQEGGSEGNTTGTGDRGVPGGTPGAANYEGSPGNGTGGISHTLGSRRISPSRFEAEFNESGTVVIRVTVDRDGNIVDKRIKSSPSFKLGQLALQKLSQARFSKSSDAAPQQFGEVTIVFKTRS